LAKSDDLSRTQRWLVRKQAPIRLTALASVVGLLAIVIWDLYTTMVTGGTAATFQGEVLGDLPFLVLFLVILYYILSRYSNALEKAQVNTRYQASLVDNVADVIIATDLNFTITSWNKGAEKLYGWTTEEALGKNVIDFLKTQFHSGPKEDVIARLSKERSVRGEVSQVCKDGRTIEVKGSISALVDVEGTRIGYVNIGVDITETRRAEEALRESEEKFRSIFESSGVGIGIATPDGHIIQANPTLLSMLGLSETEIHETRIHEYIHPDDLERVMATREKMLATGSLDYQSEERFGHKGGRYRWLARTESSVRGTDGRPLYTVAILADITSRKEAEEALHLSEHEYLLLFTNMPDGFAYLSMVLDEGGKPVDCVFLKVNGEFEKLTGLKAADVVGRRVTEAIPGILEDKFDWIGAFGKVALEGKSIAFEEFSEALHRWYSVSAYSPKKGYFCAVFSDVTERMKAAVAIRDLAKFPSENPSPVLRLDGDGVVIYANAPGQSMLASLGCKVGAPAPQGIRERVREAMEANSVRRDEVEAGGVPFDLSFSPMVGSGYCNVYGVDMAVRKKAEAALRESEEKFRSMFDSSGVGMGLAAPDGRIIEANPAFLSMVGYSEAEIYGTRIQEYLHPDDVGRVIAAREKMLASGLTSFRGEARFRHKDGHYVWLSQTTTPDRDANGRLLYTIAVLEDITSRKEAQEALRESEEKFRKAFVVGPDAFCVLEEGRLLEVNDRFVAMFGYSREEAVGMSSDQLGLYDDPSGRERVLSELKTKGVVRNMELNGRRRNGEVFPGLLSASLLQAEGRNLILGTIRDITELKRAAEELKVYSTRLEELVQERTAELEETHRALLESERLAAIGRVSTQLAHDLRNPLAGIKTEAYILGELLPKSLDPRAKDTLRLLSGSADHAGKVIEDLLEYTRNLEPPKQQLELGAFIAGAATAYPIPKGIRLVVRKAPKVYVLAEHSQLAKVVNGLLENAVDAMPHGGKLTISFELKGGSVSFSVADTGAGISKPDLLKVFQPFYTTKAKGLGLGLPIARKIAEAHGGSLELKSKQGAGTKVTVTLPIASETPDRAQTPQAKLMTNRP
jgi:PAS domain S-box-containing protein